MDIHWIRKNSASRLPSDLNCSINFSMSLPWRFRFASLHSYISHFFKNSHFPFCSLLFTSFPLYSLFLYFLVLALTLKNSSPSCEDSQATELYSGWASQLSCQLRASIHHHRCGWESKASDNSSHWSSSLLVFQLKLQALWSLNNDRYWITAQCFSRRVKPLAWAKTWWLEEIKFQLHFSPSVRHPHAVNNLNNHM